MNDNDRISKYGFLFILLSSTIGVAFITVPQTAARYFGPSGWWVVLAAGIFYMSVITFAALISLRFPDQTYVQYAKKIIGTPGSMVLILLLLLYQIVFSVYEIWSFEQITNTYLLKRTPSFLLMVTFVFTAFFILRSGCEGLGRICSLTFPLVFIVWAMFTGLGISQGNPGYLLPLLPLEMDWPSAAKGFFYLITSFAAWSALGSMLIPFVRKPDQGSLVKYTVAGGSIIVLIHTLTTIACIAYFGAGETQSFLYPLVALVKSVTITHFGFFERLDLLFIAIWSISLFTSLILPLFVFQIILSKALHLKEYKLWFAPIIPWIILITSLPGNIVQGRQLWDAGWNIYTVLIFILVPLHLLIIRIKKIGIPYKQLKKETALLKKREQAQQKNCHHYRNGPPFRR